MTTFIIIFVAITVAVTLWISSPFFRVKRSPASATPADWQTAETHIAGSAEALSNRLSDLEFDRAAGKVDDAEYFELSAAATRRLQTIVPPAISPPAIAPPEVLSAAPGATEYSEYSPVLANAWAEAEILIARARRQLASRWTCAACGRVMDDSDNFCASCGGKRPAASSPAATSQIAS